MVVHLTLPNPAPLRTRIRAAGSQTHTMHDERAYCGEATAKVVAWSPKRPRTRLEYASDVIVAISHCNSRLGRAGSMSYDALGLSTTSLQTSHSFHR